MTAYRIELDGKPVDADGDEPGWWRDDNVVTVRSDLSVATYRLPARKPRVSLQRLGKGRSRLLLGGFTTTSVTIDGPTAEIEALREALV